MMSNQSSAETLWARDSERLSKGMRYMKFLVPALGISLLLGIAVLGMSIMTFVKVNERWHEDDDDHDRQVALHSRNLQSATTTSLVAAIRMDEVMSHLKELQRIATANNGTRAVDTPGFDQTVDYISRFLKANTNYNVTKTTFPFASPRLARRPTFISSIKDNITNHTHAADGPGADFHHVQFSASLDAKDFIELSAVPNVGCSEADWRDASPPVQGRAVLVKRGICSFSQKAELALQYKVRALLLYNDGASPERLGAIGVSFEQNNTLPALFLSARLGQRLATATQQSPKTTKALISIVRRYDAPITSANICADTPTGNATHTIVIGSHSDSVPEGPGINDNGSGSAANLALAVALARLFRTPAYPKYKYRVRFCWWGAEEVGLLGSDAHVEAAKKSTIVGERLSDYLINLNYDMLASPNYIFGISDAATAEKDTPKQALSGSNKITALFRNWFSKQNLPWDNTDLSGRSDYASFLAAGVVSGGLFSGADDMKTQEERDRYDRILGQGMGGISGVWHDPCYHKACDTIQNINVFAFEKMVQAAAYALEFLAQQDDLKSWLYPGNQTRRVTPTRPKPRAQRDYDPVTNTYVELARV